MVTGGSSGDVAGDGREHLKDDRRSKLSLFRKNYFISSEFGGFQ